MHSIESQNLLLILIEITNYKVTTVQFEPQV